MTDEIDAGPVYYKRDLHLDGSAQQIYERSAKLCISIIELIVKKEPVPIEQNGTVTIFSRRTPLQSEFPNDLDIDTLYDFIRMLDADGYPNAYIKYGKLKFEFSNANYDANGDLNANVEIKEQDE